MSRLPALALAAALGLTPVAAVPAGAAAEYLSPACAATIVGDGFLGRDRCDAEIEKSCA